MNFIKEDTLLHDFTSLKQINNDIREFTLYLILLYHVEAESVSWLACSLSSFTIQQRVTCVSACVSYLLSKVMRYITDKQNKAVSVLKTSPLPSFLKKIN